VFSGLVLGLGDWRWLFVPSTAIALLVAGRVVPAWGAAGASPGARVGGPSGVGGRSRARAGVDVLSAGLAVLAVGGGTIALNSALEHGLPVGATVALGLAGCASAVVFVRRQHALARRGAAPVLDLRAFAGPRLGRGATSIGVGMAGLFGVFALLPIVAVTAVGLSPVEAGLIMLPGGLLMGLLAPIVGRLAERVRGVWFTAPGFVTMALAAVSCGALGPGAWGLLLALHLALSVGFAFTVTPLYLDALGPQAPELVPHASTILSTVQQVAGGVGTVAVIAVAVVTPAAGFAPAGALLALAALAQALPGPRRSRV
jgi:DHA2 family lincomycin resistance protein-like MFS transporter